LIGVVKTGNRIGRNPIPEETMEISWRHDIDTTLEDAKAQHRPVLLDFSAAPM
jgi:hypothetical protein